MVSHEDSFTRRLEAKGNPEVAYLTTIPNSNFDLRLTSRAY